MSDPYGLPEDLRRLIPGARTHLNTSNTHLLESPLCVHHHGLTSASATPLNNTTYDPNMVGDVFYPRTGFTHHHFSHHHHDYSSSSGVNPATAGGGGGAATVSDHAFCSMESAEKGWFGFDSGNNRWPRQETLSLLEIRSRLDSKFRENNQKAPLWNEISRIMGEEFGYQRSGKKCKEKFENLYKYYKKTKEGKASRQDGKHYRFFRQLEAICGDQANTINNAHASTSDKTHHRAAGGNTATTNVQTQTFTMNNQDHNGTDSNNNNPKCSESLSISNSSEFETSSSENNNDEDLSAIAFMMKQQSRDQKQKGLELDHHRRVRKSWRAKVEEIVDSHMRKIIETQDSWMERMLSVVEQREQEMASREEERKRKESMWFDQQVHELWAKEKAWVEARDAALIEVVKKHIGIGSLEAALPLVEEEQPPNKNNNIDVDHNNRSGSSSRWTEMEISNLIQLRTSFEQRFRENINNGYLENGVVWDEIAGKLGCLGFDRSGSECKQIWDEISISLRRTVDDECSDGAKRRPWYLGLKLTDDDDDL